MGEPMPRRGHRIDELNGVARWAVIVAVAGFAVVPFTSAAIALAQGWQPTGDVAVIGLRSRDVAGAEIPLLGQTSTAEELTGTPANHPGPIEYWVLAASTAVAGPRAGMVLGIAAINGLALAGTVWLAHRRGGVALIGLVAATTAGLVASLGSGSLHDPFNPEVATYPMLLAVLATWSVVVGDLRIAPILAAALVVVGQVHLAGIAIAVPLALLALVAVLDAARRHRAAVRRDAPSLVAAVGILVVGWLPPIVHELSSDPSNVAALWEAATVPRPRIGLSFVGERLATAVAPIPIFLRSTGRFGFLEEVGPVRVYLAAAIAAAVAALPALVGRGRQRNHPGRLAVVVLVAMGVVVVSSAGQPPLSAFRADGTRWLWVFSLALWVSALWSAWHLLEDDRQAAARRWAAPVGTGLAVVVLVTTLATADLADERDGSLMPVTGRVGDALVDELPPGTYHLRFEGSRALVAVGPGLAYRLEAAGSSVVLDDNVFTRGYGEHRTDGRSADADLRVSSDGLSAAEPGEELIAESLIDPDDPDAGVIRVFRS
ncbi:MAG: hypothetical protein KDA97_11700 [Acidimicrobiales bacterium]|nr:hypothetical protein [Acidimicrobiales bacterium]